MDHAPPPRIRLWRQTAYASGNGAKNLIWSSCEIALLFVFTDVLGLPPALAGGLILASLVWDALLDPLIGAAADRVGRFGPFIVFGAPALGLSFVALLAGPSAGLTGLGYAAISLFALRTAYSIVDIPHNALLARLAKTTRDRTRLAGVRFVFSALASLLIGTSLPALLSGGSVRAAQDNLVMWSIAIAAISTSLLWAAALASRPFDQGRAGVSASAGSLLKASVEPLRSRAVRHVLALALIGAAATPLFAKSTLYFAAHVLGDAGLASPALIAIAIGQLLGVPLWVWAASRFGAFSALVAAHGVAGCAGLGLFADAALSGPVFSLIAGVHGVGAGGVYALIWTLAAETADRGEGAGARPAGVGAVFGLVIMIMQIGSGIGSALLGAALSIAGYDPAVVAAPAASLAILSAAALGPAVGAMCAVLATLVLGRPAR